MDRFAEQFLQDVVLWLVAWVFFGIFRLGMIVGFSDKFGAASEYWEVARAMATGARFDAMVASYPILPSFVLSALCMRRDYSHLAQRIRRAAGTAAIVSHTVICSITVGYFREYHDQFNQWIFGLVTDDRRAIALTIWRQYPVGWYLVGWISVGVLVWRYLPKLMQAAAMLPRPHLRRSHAGLELAIVGLAAAVLFWSFRGYGLRRPIKQRDLAATKDVVLNRLVANPYVALRYAILDHRYVKSAVGLSTFLQSQSLNEAVRLQFKGQTTGGDLDTLCIKHAAGSPLPKPRHIFLIVCESFDGWALFPEHRPLGLAPELVKLSQAGVYVRAFMPAGGATVDAIATIVSGLPETGINLTYQPASGTAFPTACAPMFRRLGYRTRWFYGGFPSWQRVDEFCLAQGFDEVIGLPSFSNLPRGAIGTWGAFDEFLFKHVLDTLSDDTPSFNLILTTSNHPPYDCDVVSRGFPGIPDALLKFKNKFEQGMLQQSMGHLWYTDRCVGEFVRTASQKFGGALFAITGDHPSRRTPNGNPTLTEMHTVPFVVFGAAIKDKLNPPSALAGSHLDIVPTLLELCAPSGFEYWTMGRNMFAQETEPMGIGRGAVVTPGWLFASDFSQKPAVIPGSLDSNPPSVDLLRKRWESVHSLGWWRAMKGSQLP